MAEIVRTEIDLPSEIDKGKLAFTLDNVMTPEECQEWIQKSEEKGYEKALLNAGGGAQYLLEEHRKSQRCLLDSPEMADIVFQRIKAHIPEKWLPRGFSKEYEYSVVSLNERLRFLKYHPGDYFRPHCDGAYARPDGSEMSFITIQLYLNNCNPNPGMMSKLLGSGEKYDFEGGATTFLTYSTESKQKRVPCYPKAGRVLVFEHKILHEGSEVTKGIKYSMRTDIMYKRTVK